MLNKFNLILAVLFCLTLGVSCFGQAAVLETMPPLNLNIPIDSSFAAGETQTFALRLESNQFASLVLNQNDIGAVRNQSGAYFWYTAQSTNGFRAEQWGQSGDQ